jgi:signal transduction histidine kinase
MATKAISVDISLQPHLSPIKADEAQIQQVVMNLISNAAESIEKQPGLVRITTGSRI